MYPIQYCKASDSPHPERRDALKLVLIMSKVRQMVNLRTRCELPGFLVRKPRTCVYSAKVSISREIHVRHRDSGHQSQSVIPSKCFGQDRKSKAIVPKCCRIPQNIDRWRFWIESGLSETQHPSSSLLNNPVFGLTFHAAIFSE